MSIVAATASFVVGAGVAYFDAHRKREALKATLDIRKPRRKSRAAKRRGASLEKAQALRDELKRTIAIRESELIDDEEQFKQHQATTDRRVAVLKERDERLAQQFANIKAKKEEVHLLREEVEHLDKLVIAEAEKVAGARCDTLLEHLSIELCDEARVAAQKAASIWVEQSKDRGEIEARRIMNIAIHRYGIPRPAERLHVLVNEPRKADRKKRLQHNEFELLEALTELSEVSFEWMEDTSAYYLRGPDPFTREVGVWLILN